MNALKKPDNKKKNSTVQDIANVVGISASSVSRALNDHDKISQATKDKVWAVAKELGYKATLPAFMTPVKTKSIYFLLPDLKTNLYRDAISGAQEIAKQNGYNLFIAITQNSAELEKMYSDSILNQGIGGVIIVNHDVDSNRKSFRRFQEANIPVVFINKSDIGAKSCEIIPDFSHGAYKAVLHFISMQCKRIAIFTGDVNEIFYADMVNGYSDAMSESGLEVHRKNILSNSLKPTDIESSLNDLLQKKELPDAILAPNTAVSMVIANWLKSKKRSIPEDVVLVSFSDSHDSSFKDFSLSTVQFSGAEIGTKAAEKIMEQIKSNQISSEKIIITSKFIIKASSLKV